MDDAYQLDPSIKQGFQVPTVVVEGDTVDGWTPIPILTVLDVAESL